uniref:Sperm flagellar 2 n=1 Tax=Fundulus heteroclitus TaxID=8078 RepID=A0A3Q2PZP4_FUNHE
MSDILSRWLNHEVGLSESVDPGNFAKDFSNGYLFGEILHKYQMQEDFNMFLKNDTPVSKLSNFSRLEPSLQLLGVFFDKNTARDLMQEKPGVATNLLHQLHVALEWKRSTGANRTVMQPTVRAKVHKKEKESRSLPIVVKPNADKNLQKTGQQYAAKSQHTNYLPEVTQPIRQKQPLKVHNEKRMENNGQVPKNLENKSHYGDPLNPADSSFGGIKPGSGVPGSKNKPILQSNSKYIQGIRQRLKENAVAREEGQKRVDSFLLEQSKAHEAQQEMQLEDLLVRRMMRQSQQEQRLAEQLMQIRRQKEVIVENRLFREQQYQQQRERDFLQALNREAVLAQQAKLAREEEIKKELELCNRLAAERAQSRHEKHVATCSDILGQIVDLATQVGEYRLSTGSLLPEKKSKELKELFLRGVSLYEPRNSEPESGFFLSTNPSELKKQEILNNLDYNEYTNMVGEWAWPMDSGETKLPPSTNIILAHVLQRLRKIAHSPTVESSAPSFSQFRIKACVLSKFCSGKTSCLAKIGEGKKKIKNLITKSEKGNVVPNELIVDMLIEAISQVPPQSGWILDGFPLDISQAHMLEKALGGSVEEEGDCVSNATETGADPDLLSPLPPHPPVLDLALLLDIPDERLHALCYGGNKSKVVFLPHWSFFFPNRLKILLLLLSPHTQTAPSFRDAWPELEKWFGAKQNILVRLDADVEEGELYSAVESVMQEVIKKKQEGDFFASYVNNIKQIMQQLRLQLTFVDRHLFNVRERYSHYLGSPDLKQELVSQWQKDFNSVPDDMRKDEETKAELHLRMDELQERLWDITDKHREEDEQERKALICDRWLEEQAAMLINHHSMITQVTCSNLWNFQERETKEQETIQEKVDATKKGSSSAKKAKKEHQYFCGYFPVFVFLCFVENSAKVRLELVKCHGLMLVESLQSRVQETFGNMEKLFQRRYLSEMKWYDLKLFLNSRLLRNCQLFPDVSPPPRPAPAEKPNRSTLTVSQLESLHCQLSKIAPSGLMSSSAFFIFLEDLVSNSLGRNIVPEAWTDLNQTQLLEMVSLLSDEYELIDWRRFLLSAALPWPLPSLTQLLDFMGCSTFLFIDQQTELWFCSERVQGVPEDPSEPLPYNRLASLRKFFFQLFADPTSSPPQLDYVSMLQYFAADPNPRQGFIRALSVVLGQHLQQPSQSLLVKNLENVYTELGYNPDESVPFSILSKHPYTEMLIESSTHFQLVVSLCKYFCISVDPLIPNPPTQHLVTWLDCIGINLAFACFANFF